MRPFLLYIISVITLFSSCDWVNDDLSDCPSGTWLKITYTYNILNVDAASSQVGDITILAFDKNDKYVGRVNVDSITLNQGYYKIKMPFPDGNYNLIVWGGMCEETYHPLTLKTGETDRKTLLLSLICDNQYQYNKELKPLFYSCLENVNISNEYQVLTASLIKNTNYFSCILQDEANLPLDHEDFVFTLESANGIIDYTNLPMCTESFYYSAYQQESTVVDKQRSAVCAGLNTLRIIKGDQTMLSIRHKPSDKELLRLPLTQYLLLSKEYSPFRKMDDQEYLDRQDSHTLVFFIKQSNVNIPQISMLMNVNGWEIRLNDTELEN